VTTARDAADPRTNAETRERARRASRHRKSARDALWTRRDHDQDEVAMELMMKK
jgi:hypothetical protein